MNKRERKEGGRDRPTDCGRKILANMKEHNLCGILNLALSSIFNYLLAIR